MLWKQKHDYFFVVVVVVVVVVSIMYHITKRNMSAGIYFHHTRFNSHFSTSGRTLPPSTSTHDDFRRTIPWAIGSDSFFKYNFVPGGVFRLKQNVTTITRNLLCYQF
jgi:hypothetical protein